MHGVHEFGKHWREVLELINHDKPQLGKIAALSSFVPDEAALTFADERHSTPHEPIEVFLLVRGETLQVASVH